MCKVYNSVGCLTIIKSHLRLNNLNEFNSLNELIKFQKDYSFTRQQIISNHSCLIEQEKNTLIEEIAKLDIFISVKKSEVEQLLTDKLETLRSKLNNAAVTSPNTIHSLVNAVKKAILKLKIYYGQRTFNLKIEQAVKFLTNIHSEKSKRYQYIFSNFDAAIKESGRLNLSQHDRTKAVIDQINTSIYGAIGEQKVVKELEKLPDNYILINDFNCKFNPPIYNRKENDYIKSIQVDHILVGPPGVFLIETKNWELRSIENSNLRSPVQQVKRTNFALYKLLNWEASRFRLGLNKHHWGNRKISIKNLIVFINHKPSEEFEHVKILTLDKLLGYINYFRPILSDSEIQRIAGYLLTPK